MSLNVFRLTMKLTLKSVRFSYNSRAKETSPKNPLQLVNKLFCELKFNLDQKFDAETWSGCPRSQDLYSQNPKGKYLTETQSIKT